MYDGLVKKGNAIQTTDTNNLVTKADYYKKFPKIEKKYLIIVIVKRLYWSIHTFASKVVLRIRNHIFYLQQQLNITLH